jgi:redox-sensing transcriptional repressor
MTELSVNESRKTALPSRAVVRRLSKYVILLGELDESRVWIQSHEIADQLGLTSATVRRDLTFVEVYGTPRHGYRVAKLREAVTRFIGADNEYTAVLVGAGNLGRALALHQGFRRHGFSVCGIYDCDPEVVGQTIGDLQVAHIDRIEADLDTDPAHFAILAVPVAAAQTVADQVIQAGITGILNLSLAHLTVPAHVTVVDTQIVAGLQELACVTRQNGGGHG